MKIAIEVTDHFLKLIEARRVLMNRVMLMDSTVEVLSRVKKLDEINMSLACYFAVCVEAHVKEVGRG